MTHPLLIYGANGYTGRLVSARAVDAGLRPVLAGRSRGSVAGLAGALGLAHRIADLGDADRLDAILGDVSVVLHCAGPFIHTALPMANACLRTGTHYLDITGEIPVFEALGRLDAQAKRKKIVMLPGVGFDVVPSDCLAAHLVHRLPGATRLMLAFTGLSGGFSRGTSKTMVEYLGQDVLVRENHRLKPIRPGERVRRIHFGEVRRLSTAISWGDVATAYVSTGIPNIEVHMGVPDWVPAALRLSRLASPIFRSRWMKRMILHWIEKRVFGPTDQERSRSRSLLWGRAEGPGGAAVESRMSTPNGYSLTAATAVEIARAAADGRIPPGFQTPSLALGKDFILTIEGCDRCDDRPWA
ncbi:MAG: saccharopine dehydrogenase NADP-binding domain-containing protein [Desulfobacterales bacterium]